jgi:hypothetical protein
MAASRRQFKLFITFDFGEWERLSSRDKAFSMKQ